MKRIPALLLAIILPVMLLCAVAQAESYTVRLGEYTAIYSGPGFASEFVKNVGEYGVFTIVEEVSCDNALWGRLKSGAGWVRLTDTVFTPYTIPLQGDEEIYAGPGMDYDFVKTVGEYGIYTIVEEVSCDYYIWGRLQSGAGWVPLFPLEPEMTLTPYTVNLEYWLPVHEGPSYDFGYKTSIGEDGVYTIVEEAWDYEGNLWGQLKSGAGWVDLTHARTAKDAPYIAVFADDVPVDQKNGFFYSAEESPYATKILFLANTELTNVRFSLLDLDEFDYAPGKTLYTIDKLTPDTPFVAEVVFYGDLTAYGLSFNTDGDWEYHYATLLSGRNGSLVTEGYVP